MGFVSPSFITALFTICFARSTYLGGRVGEGGVGSGSVVKESD